MSGLEEDGFTTMQGARGSSRAEQLVRKQPESLTLPLKP